MIIRPIHRIHILYIVQGSFLRRLWLPVALLFLFSCAVSYYQTSRNGYHVPLTAGVFTLLGIALAIYHGFCNNAAYERFWEGRKQWGTLIAQTRSFARCIATLPQLTAAEREQLLRLTIAFCHCLRHQLRRENSDADLYRLLPESSAARIQAAAFKPLECSQMLGEAAAALYAAGRIDSIVWQHLDASIERFTAIQASCERINNTPIPFAYFVLMHRTVVGYCFLLPFGLAGSIGWVTPIMCTFVGYTFFALNEIVDEISDPFGTGENDIALTAMCRTIEAQLAHLGGLDLPQSADNASPRRYIFQ